MARGEPQFNCRAHFKAQGSQGQAPQQGSPHSGTLLDPTCVTLAWLGRMYDMLNLHVLSKPALRVKPIFGHHTSMSFTDKGASSQNC